MHTVGLYVFELGSGRTRVEQCRLRADNNAHRWAVARRGSWGELQLARRVDAAANRVCCTWS